MANSNADFNAGFFWHWNSSFNANGSSFNANSIQRRWNKDSNANEDQKSNDFRSDLFITLLPIGEVASLRKVNGSIDGINLLSNHQFFFLKSLLLLKLFHSNTP